MLISEKKMKNYKFTAQCKSGKTKTVEFEADGYRTARKKLQEFIESN